MLDQFSRTQLLIGKEAMEKLRNSRVAVFGIGSLLEKMGRDVEPRYPR